MNGKSSIFGHFEWQSRGTGVIYQMHFSESRLVRDHVTLAYACTRSTEISTSQKQLLIFFHCVREQHFWRKIYSINCVDSCHSHGYDFNTCLSSLSSHCSFLAIKTANQVVTANNMVNIGKSPLFPFSLATCSNRINFSPAVPTQCILLIDIFFLAYKTGGYSESDTRYTASLERDHLRELWVEKNVTPLRLLRYGCSAGYTQEPSRGVLI